MAELNDCEMCNGLFEIETIVYCLEHRYFLDDEFKNVLHVNFGNYSHYENYQSKWIPCPNCVGD